MKLTLSLAFILSCQSLFACLCGGPSFCEYAQSLSQNDRQLIFLGSFIQEFSIGGSRTRMQFEIEQVYRGEVVTPNSPLYTGETNTNSDSTVWVLSGGEGICLRDIYKDSLAIFAVQYNSGFPGEGFHFGYVPTVCENDYFPISDQLTVTGRIFDQRKDTTLSITEFEEVIRSTCFTSSTTELTKSFEAIKVFPQPAADYINIQLPNELDDLSISIFDLTGKNVLNVQSFNVDISSLETGVYYLSFSKNRQRHTRKLVKI